MPKNATYVPTPAEEEALKYHRQNLERGTYLRNPDGSLTTFYGTVIGDDNGAILIPTYWYGAIREPEQAMRFALKSGINFPKYKNVRQALAAEKALHNIMESDIATYEAKPTSAR